MINILLIIAEVIVAYLLLYFLDRRFNLEGIYIFSIIATIAACIMTLKNISIMEISVPLGLGVTTSLIIGGNIITQKYGKDKLKKYLLLIFITAMIGSCFLNLSGFLEDSKYNLYANKSYSSIFKYNLRIYVALTISLVLSVFLSSELYYLIKRVQNKVIINNVLSIIIVEFVENIVFVLIAYLSEFETIDIALCIVFRYLIKIIIGMIGTIPLYIINRYNKQGSEL